MDFYATNATNKKPAAKPAAKSAKPLSVKDKVQGILALIAVILFFGVFLYCVVYLEYKDYLLLMENGEYASAVVYRVEHSSSSHGKYGSGRRTKWVSYTFIVGGVEYRGK